MLYISSAMAIEKYINSGIWSEALHIYLYEQIVFKSRDPSLVSINGYETFELTDELVDAFNTSLISGDGSIRVIECWLDEQSEQALQFQKDFGIIYKPKVEMWSDREKTEYYKTKLQSSFEFEMHIAMVIKNAYGVELGIYLTPEGQYIDGENRLGIEIKHDMMFRKTGNLYIEYGEKSRPKNPTFVNSGILKEDKSQYFLIGDYEQVWIFRKRRLIEIYNEETALVKEGKKSSRNIRFVGNPTSRGFIYEIGSANDESISLDIVMEEIAHTRREGY